METRTADHTRSPAGQPEDGPYPRRPPGKDTDESFYIRPPSREVRNCSPRNGGDTAGAQCGDGVGPRKCQNRTAASQEVVVSAGGSAAGRWRVAKLLLLELRFLAVPEVAGHDGSRPPSPPRRHDAEPLSWLSLHGPPLSSQLVGRMVDRTQGERSRFRTPSCPQHKFSGST